MRTARMMALLVLAAVFSMHGLQCVAGGPETRHGGIDSMQGASSAGSDGAAPAVSSVVDVGTGSGAHIAAMMADDTPATGQTPIHGAAHALAVCVAILLAGFAVLGALLALRRSACPRGLGPALVRARSWWTTTQLLRPPDLASLCLLRI